MMAIAREITMGVKRIKGIDRDVSDRRMVCGFAKPVGGRHLTIHCEPVLPPASTALRPLVGQMPSISCLRGRSCRGALSGREMRVR